MGPQKQVVFFENGREQIETDMIQVSEESAGFKKWGAKAVPHGLSVVLSSEGRIAQIMSYKEGLSHGMCAEFYPNGEKSQVVNYIEGEKRRKSRKYFEDGSISEQVFYENDIPCGEAEKISP